MYFVESGVLVVKDFERRIPGNMKKKNYGKGE